MIFSRKKPEILDPYSVEQCTLCNNTKKRKFSPGDYIFKQTGQCTSCSKSQMIISKIYGEAVK